MLSSLKDSIKKLRFSKEFLSYKKKNPKAYLSACFLVDDEDWQIDFYCQEKNKMTTFTVNEAINVKESKGILQKNKIRELKTENVKVDIDEIIKKIDYLVNEEYKENKDKTIIILQNINKKETWNIICLTESFKVINVKLDASDGKIIEKKVESIFNFKGSKISG